MECNKDDAIKARDRASECLASENYSEAKRFALKAQRLYPELADLPKVMAIAEVMSKETDAPWYEILQVEKHTEEESVKKQYKKLLLLLHPDKNKNTGAGSAFKLVKDAFDLFEKDKTLGRNVSNANDAFDFFEKENDLGRNVSNVLTCTKCGHIFSNAGSGLHQYVQCPRCLHPFLAENLHNHPGKEPFQRETTSVWTEPDFRGSCSRVIVDFTDEESDTCDGNSDTNEKISSGKKEPDGDGDILQKEEEEALKELGVQIQDQENGFVETRENAAPHQQDHYVEEDMDQAQLQKNVHVVAGDPMEKYEDRSATGLDCSEKKQEEEEAELQQEDIHLQEEVFTDLSGGRHPRHPSPVLSDIGKEPVDEKSSPSVSAGHGKRPVDEVTGINVDNDSSSSLQELDSVNDTVKLHRIETRSQKRFRTARDNGEQNMMMKRPPRTIQRSARRSDRVEGEHPDGNISPFGTTDFLKLRRELFENLKVHILTGFKGEGTQVVDVEWAEGSSSQASHNRAPIVATEREFLMNLNVKFTIPDVMEEMPDQQDNVESLPDNDVFNYENHINEDSFEAGQIWAIYDDDDGLPRFYGYIVDASVNPFAVKMRWLYPADPVPRDVKKWVDAGFSLSCGEFEAREEITQDSVKIFSHMMAYNVGEKSNVYRIYPQKGDVWALYKDWKPRKGETAKIFPVFVASDFSPEFGVEVFHLEKVKKFKSIYCRKKTEPVKHIPAHESCRFSHQIPAHYLSGKEMVGLPDNSYDLDIAALMSHSGFVNFV